MTRIITPIPGLGKRADPQTPTGNIWTDSAGRTRAIMVLQLSESLVQAFDNSGFNLAKAVLSELLQYGRDNGFTNIVRRNLWNAEFNAGARTFLPTGNTPFMTLAITSRGSVDGIEATTSLLQSWFERDNKFFAVMHVDNALAIIRKRSDAPASVLEARGGNFCGAGSRGFANLAVNQPTSAISLETSC